MQERTTNCTNDARVRSGATTLDICVGADLFLRETFNGNGRSCATCHPVANNFTIDPDFIATLPPTDPLFIAENNKVLAELEKPTQMRAFSLILENVDGLEDPTKKFVLRSVPHNFSMGVSVTSPGGEGPVERTGWSGDGAPNGGALRQFQQGAITQHYPKSLKRVNGVDFRLATERELDTIEIFMKELGRKNDLVLANVTLTDARAEAGRAVFMSTAVGCNACHGNAGANASFAPGNFNFLTGVERVRATALASFPIDGGLGGTAPAPGGGLGDATFNTPPLVEAADTGPFFHTATRISGASTTPQTNHNTEFATTIEEAVAFYDTEGFNPPGQPPGIDLTGTEIDDIGRFLRVINASFNIHLGLSRIDAAHKVSLKFGNEKRAIQNELIRLAQVEIYDALEVLYGIPPGTPALNNPQATLLQNACATLDDSLFETKLATRRQQYQSAITTIKNANGGLGTNLTFTIGQGTNMF